MDHSFEKNTSEVKKEKSPQHQHLITKWHKHEKTKST